MTLRWLLAALHLVALGLGGGAIFTRGFTLRRLREASALPSVFFADSLWGLAALLWISTGLIRAFGGFEKGSAYYLQSTTFWTKMVLLALVIVLEMWPMVTLVRWRGQLRRGASIDLRSAPLMARISYVQGGIILIMILAATAMARGLNL